jgi:hypothetical protein
MHLDTTLIRSFTKSEVQNTILLLQAWQMHAIEYYAGITPQNEKYIANTIASLMLSLNYIKQNHITLRGL